MVTGAVAVEGEPGVDGDMRIELEFPGGTTGLVRTSMQSPESYIYAKFIGEDGELEIENPFIPMRGNQLTITSRGASRSETATTEPSYNFQLRALADVLLRGAPVVTDLDGAVKNMEVIDAAYLAAGMNVRKPTSV
jgi:hypothetical protein